MGHALETLGLAPQNSIMANIGLYSYGAALLIYTLLSAQIFLTRRNRPLATPLLAASVLTAVWAGVVAGSTLLPYPLVTLMHVTEVARNAAWCFLLLHLIGLRLKRFKWCCFRCHLRCRCADVEVKGQ